ncbi:hypothetical protein BN159_8261 [Streptomyces davaonensis JCM 4913]|uniref:Uncharacterized protein n=1 Tax=Streptomyces davaonensis (strain DSM 101723 / JCM 4913 / KCC S-0913 / 768) TaxID=1214101 RepID=K4RGX8_STRDJ|nr:hypothetical protein [Streptomyces davaonensis]CCK32639.1 hypothetical protein BN159_8261 [Streptomyces davaonensis JCM 4913]
MRIEIRVATDDGPTTLDLYRWLRRDPDVRGHADLCLGAPADDATMGAADVIDVVLGHGIAALNLALSYVAWRAARPSAPAVTLTVDGVSVTVQGPCDEETVRLLTGLLERRTSGSDLESV